MYSRATTSAMAERWVLPAGFWVLAAVDISARWLARSKMEECAIAVNAKRHNLRGWFVLLKNSAVG